MRRRAAAAVAFFGLVGAGAEARAAAGRAAVDLDLADAVLRGAAAGAGLGARVSVGDLDGDGLPEVAVAAVPEDGAGSAWVWVFAGSADGERTTADAVAAVGPVDSGGGPVSVSLDGDLDGDGRSDLVIGVPGSPAAGDGRGEVLVFYGPLDGEVDPATADARRTGAVPGGGAGWAVDAAGDLDGDGRSDLVVGAPFGAAAGLRAEAYSLLGPVLGVASLARADAVFRGAPGAGELGYAVATGDVDGDGRDDVVLGDPAHQSRRAGATGAVRVFLSPVAGARADSQADATLSGEEPGAGFGASVAARGDLDGDGRADLAVGAPEDGPDGSAAPSGRVFVFTGVEPGPRAAGDASATVHGDPAGSGFGTALSTATDADGDGEEDLLIAAPDDPVLGAPGTAAYLFARPASGDWGPARAASVYRGTGGLGSGTAEVLSLGFKDADGDGVADVLLGVPDEDGAEPAAGAVRIFRGRRR